MAQNALDVLRRLAQKYTALKVRGGDVSDQIEDADLDEYIRESLIETRGSGIDLEVLQHRTIYCVTVHLTKDGGGSKFVFKGPKPTHCLPVSER